MRHPYFRKFFQAIALQLVFVLLINVPADCQQVGDTALARQYYEKGVVLRKAGSYDSAFHYWRIAGEIYKANNVWHDYLITRYSLGFNKNVNGDYEEGREISAEGKRIRH